MPAGWRVLERALTNPDTGILEDISEVAEDAGVSEDTVYKWIRRPSRKKDPKATGRKNPIDYFLRLLRAVYLTTPWGARLIMRYVLSEFARLEAKHGHEGPILVAWPSLEKKGKADEESSTDQKKGTRGRAARARAA
jgi:hypothetical protein